MWGSREQLMVEEALIDSPEALNLMQKVLEADCGGRQDHSCASGKLPTNVKLRWWGIG